jgi:RHS repeat-associated protein
MRLLSNLLLCIFTIVCFAEENLEDRIILSTPEQISTLYSERSQLIGGLVSPLSGQVSLRQTDLVIKGAESLHLTRSYLAPSIPSSFPRHKKKQEEWNKYYLGEYLLSHYKGWVYLPQLLLEYCTGSNSVRYTDANGATLEFILSSNLKAKLSSEPYAIHNTAGETPSGQYDPRNTEITYSKTKNTFTVKSPDGTLRLYSYSFTTSTGNYLFLLQKEILPHGKVLSYSYAKNSLISIESKDPKERYTYAKLTIDNHLTLKGGSLVFKTPANLQAEHKHTRRQLKYKLDVIPTTGQKVTFHEVNPILPSLLTEVHSPFFQGETLSYDQNFLLENFLGKDHTFKCSYATYDNHYKLQTLSFPVGPNASFTPVYTLDYHPPIAGKQGGHTLIKQADGTYIQYDFSKDLLTTSIKWLDEQKTLKKQKILTWTKSHYLSSIEIQDKTGTILHKKTYDYDTFGNPTLETLHGNLTGKSPNETYTITREYSKDGRNLLLKEQTEEGKITKWEYLPETNLLTTKLIYDQEQILLREFHTYDDSNNLIQTIHDDGSSADPNNLTNVTQRTLTTYHLRQEQPFLHMPESCTLTYSDQGEEKLLKQTHFVYDTYGNIKEEHIYDSNGKFAYTLYKTYNQRGNLLSETTPLGEEVTYDYDLHGRLKYKTSPSNRLHTTLSYDKQGRLTQKEETGENLQHLHTYDYDPLDRLTQKTDPFENPTTYTYDPLTHQTIQTDFPPIASLEGSSLPIQTHATYDPLGRPLTQTDPNGNTTHTTYNAHGSPLSITYADDTQETHTYYKNGQPASYTDPDGLTVHYKRDILGRVLKKTYSTDEKLAEESYTYSGFNLLSHTNKEKHTKQFFYDGAGRKIREEYCGHVTHFTYNPLGFLEKITYENDENTLVIFYTRDNLGQILKEEKSNLAGEILYKKAYTYDSDGNQITLTHYIDSQKAKQTFEYDPFGRLTLHIDPLGYLTTYHYQENHLNTLGQKTLQIKITDPLRITKIKTHNAHGQITEETTLDPHHQTIAHHQNIYDPSGNRIYRIDDVYHDTSYQYPQITKQTYNKRHLLESTTRGYDTLDPRTTLYDYSPAGKLEIKTNPDGITLNYYYNDLGFLESLQSSDRQIDHSFKHNKEGQLLSTTDENTKDTLTRHWDPHGNLIQEILPSGLTLQKSYDNLNRTKTLNISDIRTIHYTYNPLHLKQVTLTNNQNSYTHTYNTYDLSGNLLTETPIHNLNTIHHHYDIKGRPTQTSSPYLTQTTTYDPKDQIQTTTLNTQETHYTYDPLGQLQTETNTLSHTYDSLHNILTKDNQTHQITPLNELVAEDYDLNGNQRTHQDLTLTYDPLNRLTTLTKDNLTIHYTYDPLGRRLTKTVATKAEYYIYDNNEEIGALTETKTLKNLKVLGATPRHKMRQPIAIELEGKVYAPILDQQNNICKLVDPHQNIQTTYHYSAFGEKNTPKTQNPWRYFSKRTDPESNLIYFGKRYYSPHQARWLTTDPAGFTDSLNLYQYALNNPFKYYDPDGQFLFMFAAVPLIAWGAGVALPSISAIAAPIIYGAITGAVIYGSYKGIEALNAKSDDYSPKDDYTNYVRQYSKEGTKMERKKKGDVDPSLPTDPENDPNWIDVSHPEAKEAGHSTFENVKTGEKIRWDKGKPGASGHKGHDHYHRKDPADNYLDGKGKPVSDGSDPSHLYPPEWVWWE